MELPLTPSLFAIFTALVQERVGLTYGPEDHDLLQTKLSMRAEEAGFDSLLDYYYFLRYDDAAEDEIDALVDSLVVNESYLFREYPQLRYVVDRILVPAVQRGERPRVWSAACASGEEPYGLAMMLAAAGVLGGVDVVASDVSRRALERARRGELGRRAIRAVPDPALVERWVDREEGPPRVRAPLPDAIDFRRVNLLDEAAVAALGSFDVILCRNVLIYFSDELIRQLVDRLLGRLRPSGTLWVGVSESLMRLGPAVVCEEREGVFFYRRGLE